MRRIVGWRFEDSQTRATAPEKHGVYTVVLDLLQIPYYRKENVLMNELMRLAHEFLHNFGRGNQPNQALFLTPGVNSLNFLALIFLKLD
jgi:inositol 1,4,5-triphosphate receptor type 1